MLERSIALFDQFYSYQTRDDMVQLMNSEVQSLGESGLSIARGSYAHYLNVAKLGLFFLKINS